LNASLTQVERTSQTATEVTMITSSLDNRVHVSVQHADAVIAAGLTFALQQQSEFVLCDYISCHADLVICDYVTGLEFARTGKALAPRSKQARLLVLTERDSEESVRQAMQHGVHGYLLRGAGIEDLVQAIRTVGRGQRFLSPSVAQRMADSMARESLTERETEVLDLLAAGYGNKIIASLLGITAGTVKTHVQAVMGKLNAASRTQAVSIAMRRGMVAMERRALH